MNEFPETLKTSRRTRNPKSKANEEIEEEIRNYFINGKTFNSNSKFLLIF